MRLTLRQWDDDSVELRITHCGVCGSDTHTLEESWAPIIRPFVPGHEIIGIVTKVGKNVTHLKIGERAGVGPQCKSCRKCEPCKAGQENLCIGGFSLTYNSLWPSGEKCYGGYSDKWRGDCQFVYKIPDSITSEEASTLLCSGVTTFVSLKRTNVSHKSIIGVVGIGGLGHYGILFAKAMGAKTIGLSRDEQKRKVALELGCDDYIAMNDEAQLDKYKKKFTHILCTGTGPDFNWNTYFSLLCGNGHFMNLMLPAWKLPQLDCISLNLAQISIHGSFIGSINETKETLEFAAEKNIHPWVQSYPMNDVHKALDDFRAGKARFKIVLEN